MEAKYVKRAVKREPDGTPIGTAGNLYLDCECGHHLRLPMVKGLPMTYQCLCGLEYDAFGWILVRKAVQS